MIDDAKKDGILAVFGYKLVAKPNSWEVWAPDPITGLAYRYNRDTVYWSEETARLVAWSLLLQNYELYLHKKGGIYRKQDERTIRAGDFGPELTIVNYEHIYPHERAPGCRLKVEWETPGRFVRITNE